MFDEQNDVSFLQRLSMAKYVPVDKNYITDGQLNVERKKKKKRKKVKKIPKNQTRIAHNHSNYSSDVKEYTKRTISITCIWRSTHGWRNNEIVLRSYRNDAIPSLRVSTDDRPICDTVRAETTVSNLTFYFACGDDDFQSI